MRTNAINNINFGANFVLNSNVYSDTACPECRKKSRGQAYSEALKNSPELADKIAKFSSFIMSPAAIKKLTNLPSGDSLVLSIDVKTDYYDYTDGTRKPVLDPSITYKSEYDSEVDIPQGDFNDIVDNPAQYLGSVSRALGNRVNINA